MAGQGRSISPKGYLLHPSVGARAPLWDAPSEDMAAVLSRSRPGSADDSARVAAELATLAVDGAVPAAGGARTTSATYLARHKKQSIDIFLRNVVAVELTCSRKDYDFAHDAVICTGTAAMPSVLQAVTKCYVRPYVFLL